MNTSYKLVLIALLITTFDCTQKVIPKNEICFKVKNSFYNDYSGFILFKKDTIFFVFQESIDQSFGFDLEKYAKLQYFDIENHQLLDSLNLLNENSLFLNNDKISNIYFSDSINKLVLINKSLDSITLNIKSNYYRLKEHYINNFYNIKIYNAIKFSEKKLLARVEKNKILTGVTFFAKGKRKDELKLSKMDIETIIDFSK